MGPDPGASLLPFQHYYPGLFPSALVPTSCSGTSGSTSRGSMRMIVSVVMSRATSAKGRPHEVRGPYNQPLGRQVGMLRNAGTPSGPARQS